jgi:signal transduction histidine kinase
LANLSRRLEEIHGRCEVRAAAAGGTTVQLIFPLPQKLPI